MGEIDIVQSPNEEENKAGGTTIVVQKSLNTFAVSKSLHACVSTRIYLFPKIVFGYLLKNRFRVRVLVEDVF